MRSTDVFALLLVIACGIAVSCSAEGQSRTEPVARAPAPVRPAPPAPTPLDAAPADPEPAIDAGADAASSEGDAGAADAADAAPEPPPSYAFHAPLRGRTLPKSAPAMRFANLSPAACRKELSQRKLPVKRWHGAAKGIATPLRFAGPMHGVTFVAPGGKSPFGLFDCRMALALEAFAKVLAEHGVIRVRIDNLYRPNAHLPGRRRSRSQHAYGLAADITQLFLKDGRVLIVETDWQAKPGDDACGPDADLEKATPNAITLRTIVCAVAREGIFHHMLTPSYDAAHRDHFHFDIKRDANYRSVK